MFRVLVLAATLTPSLVFAQEKPDSAFLQRVIQNLQAQRNAQADAAALAETRSAILAEELTKAQARVKELDSRPAAGSQHD